MPLRTIDTKGAKFALFYRTENRYSSLETRLNMKPLKRLLTAGAILSLCLLAGCSGSKNSELKVLASKSVELGEPVSLNASEYLASTPDQSILDEITVDSNLKNDPAYEYNGFKETVTTAGKQYLECGTYEITLHYDGKKYPVTVTVQDTVMPEFISPSAVVTVPVGNTDFDFSRIYRTDDKDDVEISVDGFYDLNTEGTYPVTVIATDRSGNSNSLEITINVVAKNQHITSSDQFDDEVVPSENDSSEDDGSDSEQDDPDPIDPPQGSSGPSTACSISSAPAGTEVFYNFSDLYAAGTAWNQLSSDNYFFYLEGADDCGNKVYFLTKGTSAGGGEENAQNPAGQTN